VSSNVKQLSGASSWRGDPLPRGRHKLDAQTVRSSQRERLIRAMLETVARRGYEAMTVPEVVATARVARNAFYEFFSDKTDCFLAACEEEATDLLRTVQTFIDEPDWIENMRLAVRAYLRWWSQRDAFARAYFIGLPAAGERAIAQRERSYERFAENFAQAARRARTEQPSLPPPPALVPMMLVRAITELVAAEIRAGRTEHLGDLEDDLVFIAVKLLADDATAARAVPGRSSNGGPTRLPSL
jgi:AcrR family transcriptional regulator